MVYKPRKRPYASLLLSSLVGSSVGFTVRIEPRLPLLRLSQSQRGYSSDGADSSNSTRVPVYHSSLMKQRDRKKTANQNNQKRDFEESKSLLPPPPNTGSDGSALPNLVSWEQLFHKTSSQNIHKNNNDSRKTGGNLNKSKSKRQSTAAAAPAAATGLPPLSQLFGLNKQPDMSPRGLFNHTDKATLLLPNFTFYEEAIKIDNLSALEGVLPVSELFYRSTQAMSAQDDEWEPEDTRSTLDNSNSVLNSTLHSQTQNNPNDRNRNPDINLPQDSDDGELPFSAEQSDKILINNNKVKLRRNLAQEKMAYLSEEDTFQQEKFIISNEDDLIIMEEEFTDQDARGSTKNQILATPFKSSVPSSLEDKSKKSSKKKGGQPTSPQQQQTATSRDSSSFSRSMKMVRRGMEMLVGGIPINVDPPLRFIELNYNFSAVQSLVHPVDSDTPLEATPWAVEQYSSPQDVAYEQLQRDMDADWASIITTNSRDFGPLLHGTSVPKTSPLCRELYCEYMSMAFVKWNVGPKDYEDLITSFEQNMPKTSNNKEVLDSAKTVDPSMSSSAAKKTLERIVVETKSMSTTNSNTRVESTLSPPSSFQLLKEDDVEVLNEEKDGEYLKLGGDLKFSLDVSRMEIEATFNGTPGLAILNRVITQGLAKAIKSDSLGFDLVLAHVILNELDGGATEFTVEFHLCARKSLQNVDAERVAKKINAALAQAMDDGEVALAMGAAAKMEKSWPDALRERIVEEFLFEVQDADDIKSGTLDDEDDFESIRDKGVPDPSEASSRAQQEDTAFDGPFGMPGDAIYGKNDLFLGGGNGGVFYDYSEKGTSQAPFKGSLGPLMLDAVIQRSIQRQPRLIAIGDVHGCIDELQALLRKCDYRIGDLVLFLGDLVSKGPDSLSVVQMAREIGAIGVRGNHDFEVIRWHQAIKSGADPPVIGSEHFQIAMQLSKADLRWMYSLPWYISSKDLGALFVHAGFVSGIRLAKQNPRLMMNMRSILPDGTVTSKFFKSWPWARLWDGPQTVFFGHDADRSLQNYEHAIGLDTGCVYGGRLTACILPEKRLVSVSAKKQYFQYRRRHFD